MNRFVTAVLLVVVLLTLVGRPFAASAATVVPTTSVIAVGGQAAYGGDGAFASTSLAPSLNNAGQPAFVSVTTGSLGVHQGIFRGGPGAAQIALKGDAVPGGNGTFNGFTDGTPWVNESGQVLFNAILAGTSGGTADDRGLFRGDGASAPALIAREGQAPPDGNGTFSSLSSPGFNDAGQAVFTGTLTGTSGGSSDNVGVFRGDGSAAGLVQIARAGQATPDANGRFATLTRAALDDSSRAAFAATLTGTTGGTTDDAGIFRGDAAGIVQIVREGQAAPGGNGAFSAFAFEPALNDAGQAAFSATLTGTSGGTNDNAGIFRGDGAGATALIARANDHVPGGNGRFSSFSPPAINNAGQTAFEAALKLTSGGTNDNAGIFRGDGVTTVQMVRKGQIAPDGNGKVSGFFDPALNDAGQAAFFATFSGSSGGSTQDTGILFYDDTLGLLQVVRESDKLLGSTIVQLAFHSDIGFVGDELGGINDRGQVAYEFVLDDGRTGIALWSVPEPSILPMMAAAVVPVVLAHAASPTPSLTVTWPGYGCTPRAPERDRSALSRPSVDASR